MADDAFSRIDDMPAAELDALGRGIARRMEMAWGLSMQAPNYVADHERARRFALVYAILTRNFDVWRRLLRPMTP